MSVAAVIARRVLRRRAMLALALFTLAPSVAAAQSNPPLNEAASDVAMAFMKALRKKDVETALQFIDAPFVAEDSQLLATEADVKVYLTTLLGGIEASELPNAVLAVLDYEQSRAATAEQALKLRDAVLDTGDLLIATGRDGLSRGVLLVKAGGGKPVVVGVGY
jgi:hypothetical protein